MIIEIFGPQGVGKTTFCRALAGRLQQQGQTVDLVLSYRPAERFVRNSRGPSVRAPAAAVAIRIARPAIELLAMTLHPLAYWRDLDTSAKLLRALPPRTLVSSIRLSQYILRLSHSWRLASASSHIALFDQAFVQAVSSLLLSSRSGGETSIECALDVIPKPDMLIRLDAPADILSARLHDRQRRQSPAERMLEVDPEFNSGEIRVFDWLHDLLRKRGQAVTCFSSFDPNSLDDAVTEIADQVRASLRAPLQRPCTVRECFPNESLPHA